MPILSCRFYAERFPELEETVMVNVRMIEEMGAYVSLLEYNNIEGMILLSELSRRRIRSVNKLVRVGRNEAVVVIRVDKEKGYIDLSKRRVTTKDLIQLEDRFARAKAVNSILRHVGDVLGYDSDEQLEDLYMRTAWHFDSVAKKKAGAYDYFKRAITEPHVLDECDISDEIKQALLEDIQKRLTPQAVKIRSDIEVSCFSYEGIDAVKAALKAGLAHSTEEMPIKVQLISPPLYVVTTTTLERALGLEAVSAAIDRIRQTIEDKKGTFKIVMAPKVVTEMDETDIRKKLEDLGLEIEEEEENEEGMTAPKELDVQADAAEAERAAKAELGEKESDDDDD